MRAPPPGTPSTKGPGPLTAEDSRRVGDEPAFSPLVPLVGLVPPVAVPPLRGTVGASAPCGRGRRHWCRRGVRSTAVATVAAAAPFTA
jgi:hypothetical protein